jgi:hypothetical protein
MTSAHPESEQTASDPHTPPAPGEVPNEAEVEREFGVTDDGRPLREQRPLIDEDGDDIRQYTGEPVPTEHGYVIPGQSVVGAERVVGGGEWPGQRFGDVDSGADDDADDDDPDAGASG